MVQNLRAYFILYAITIKCTKCMQEKIEFSCMLKDKGGKQYCRAIQAIQY